MASIVCASERLSSMRAWTRHNIRQSGGKLSKRRHKQPRGFAVEVARQCLFKDDRRLIQGRSTFRWSFNASTTFGPPFRIGSLNLCTFYRGFVCGDLVTCNMHIFIKEWLDATIKEGWEVWVERAGDFLVMKIIFRDEIERLAFALKWMES